MNVHSEWEKELIQLLAETAQATMPFGKFGPLQYPPHGLPIYDLPYEYLRYFEKNGWPRGRLGELLKFVCLMKQDGADSIFEPLRQQRGGRASLRLPKRVILIDPPPED